MAKLKKVLQSWSSEQKQDFLDHHGIYHTPLQIGVLHMATHADGIINVSYDGNEKVIGYLGLKPDTSLVQNVFMAVGFIEPNIEAMVEDFQAKVTSVVVGEMDKKDLKVYDVIGGTSSGSKYVYIAPSIEKDKGFIALRYKSTTLSIRVHDVPQDAKYHDAMTLMGIKQAGGTHWSCHVTVLEGLPMQRLMIVFGSVLGELYDLPVKINMEKVKELGV